MCVLVRGSAQSHQALATLDGVTDGHQDALDGSVRRGIDLSLHLHSLEGQENLTGLNGISLGHEDLGNSSSQRSRNLALASLTGAATGGLQRS